MLPIISNTISNVADHEIISEFFTKYIKLLYNEAWKYLSVQEDVEDIVYEAFARIIANMDTFRTLKPLQRVQYGKVIVRNLSFAFLRRSAYFTMVPFEEVDIYIPIAESNQPENIVEQKIQIEQIRQIWAEMPVEDRLLLEQKYILDWTDKELADRLGIQTQSVRMRLTRAKRKVMRQLEEKNIHIKEWL